MRIHSHLITVIALVALSACPKGGVGGLPGGGSVPGGGVPAGLGGSSGLVDPNSCGNYAALEGGNRIRAFLQATQDLERKSVETLDVVRNSCEMIGRELGMVEADFRGEAKDVCAGVYGRLREYMQVSLKGKAALKIKYKPAVCRVDVEAQAKAAAECEGKASADIRASCTGTCHGRCDGTCAGKAGTGGTGGECNGECKGTCRGECEGKANVEASAQCRASASVNASIDVKCTEPEFAVELDAKLVLDKSKAEMVVKAIRNGVPRALSVKAHLEPLQNAVEIWAASARELAEMGPKIANSFKDQALCISGQLAAAVKMIGKIEANVSVSVNVSVEASAVASGSAG